MRDGAEITGSELVGAQALREWITGERREHARVFLVERGAPTRAVAEVAEADDVVLLPEDSDTYRGRASVVRYRGALSEIGDELFLGDSRVELQDYVAAAFIQIVGPTAVGLFDASGWQAFFEDAELAQRTGVFPSALIDPRVLLANRGALENPGELHTPSAIRVGSDGRVGVGVRGAVIGEVDRLPTLLTTVLPRGAALGVADQTGAVGSDRVGLDGIGRYLRATDLMKMLRLPNGAAKISGFGWALADDERADAEPLSADPFLIEVPEGLVLADTTTLRRRLLSPVTARVVAVTQTSSAPDIAAQRIASHLDISVEDADMLCREAVTALDIHLGRRADRSRSTAGLQR